MKPSLDREVEVNEGAAGRSRALSTFGMPVAFFSAPALGSFSRFNS